jgi:hypothetical protein
MLQIKDILVVSMLFNNGEYSSTKPKPKPNSIYRIKLQLTKYFESLKENQEKHANVYTRLATDEHSFYTSNSPLTHLDLSDIITFCYEYFQNDKLDYPAILVLSSFAVLFPDNKMRNVVLHVQPGINNKSDTKIHYFSKQNVAHNDPVYKSNGIDIEIRSDKGLSNNNPNAVFKTLIASKMLMPFNGLTQQNGIILIEDSNETWLHCIEICLDHHKKVGMTDLELYLTNKAPHLKNKPLNIDHLITSNYINETDSNCAASVVNLAPNVKFKHIYPDTVEDFEDLESDFGYRKSVVIYRPRSIHIMHSEMFDLVKKFVTKPQAKNLFKELLKTHHSSFYAQRMTSLLSLLDPDFLNRPILNNAKPIVIAAKKFDIGLETLKEFVRAGTVLDDDTIDQLQDLFSDEQDIFESLLTFVNKKIKINKKYNLFSSETNSDDGLEKLEKKRKLSANFFEDDLCPLTNQFI